jgi:hypothetical protein
METVMSDKNQQPRPADFTAAMNRIAATVQTSSTGDLPVMDVAESIEVGLAQGSQCIDDVARVVWAARDLVASWDAAHIVGLACQSGSGASVVLSRIEALRAALAGRSS